MLIKSIKYLNQVNIFDLLLFKIVFHIMIKKGLDGGYDFKIR